MYQYCFSSAGRGNGSTAIELRSADFSPPRSGPAQTAGSGLKSALLSCRNSLNSMPVGNGRGAMPFLMSFALEPEIVTLAWTDNASVQFPLYIYATKGSIVAVSRPSRPPPSITRLHLACISRKPGSNSAHENIPPDSVHDRGLR